MDEQDWKALARLSESPEGKRLVAMIKLEREQCRDSLEQCRDASEVLRLQGQAATLATWADNFEQARDVVHKRFTK